MSKNLKAFGQFLVDLRTESRLEIVEVVTRLGLESDQPVLDWESGKSLPPREYLLNLSRLYRIPFKELCDVWEDTNKI